jgi:hypothetical protein
MKRFAALSLAAAVCFCALGCNQNAQQSIPVLDKKAAEEAAATRPAERVRGFARGVHLVPGLGPISLRSAGKTFAAGVTYGNAAPYEGIPEAMQSSGDQAAALKVEAVGGDGKTVAGPMPVTLQAGEELTVFATGVPGKVALLPYKPKTFGAEKGKAKVAFIHAATTLPGVEVRIDGRTFRRSAKYGLATQYTMLEPGRHLMEVAHDKSLPPIVVQTEQPAIITQDTLGNVLDVTQPPPTTTVVPQKSVVTLKQEMDLQPGKVYEVVLFHGPNKVPSLRLLEDRFADALVKAKPAEH